MDERSDRLPGSIDQARRAHYFAELMKLLVDAGGTLPRGQALEVLGQRLDLTPYELERTKTGAVRWRTHLQFHFTGFVKAGYLTRGGGTWRITEEGRAAMARWSPAELLAEMQRRYSAWDQERQGAGEPEAEADDDPGEGEGEKARIWLIGTGRGGTGWPRFRDGGFVEVGFARDANGRPFGAIDTMTREQVRARMIEVTGEPNPYNDVLCAWQFAHEMRIGDLVIAKTGKSRVLGYGRITGDYECPTDGETFGHRRAVAWERKETVELPPRYLLATKTLTEIGRSLP